MIWCRCTERICIWMSVSILFISLQTVWKVIFASILFWPSQSPFCDGFVLFISHSTMLFLKKYITYPFSSALFLIHPLTIKSNTCRAKIEMGLNVSLQTVRPKKCTVSQIKITRKRWYERSVIVHPTVEF